MDNLILDSNKIKLKYKNLINLAKYKYEWDFKFMNLVAWLIARREKEIELLHVKS